MKRKGKQTFTLDDIEKTLEEISKKADTNPRRVIYFGTEEQLNKFLDGVKEEMLRQYREECHEKETNKK